MRIPAPISCMGLAPNAKVMYWPVWKTVHQTSNRQYFVPHIQHWQNLTNQSWPVELKSTTLKTRETNIDFPTIACRTSKVMYWPEWKTVHQTSNRQYFVPHIQHWQNLTNQSWPVELKPTTLKTRETNIDFPTIACRTSNTEKIKRLQSTNIQIHEHWGLIVKFCLCRFDACCTFFHT